MYQYQFNAETVREVSTEQELLTELESGINQMHNNRSDETELNLGDVFLSSESYQTFMEDIVSKSLFLLMNKDLAKEMIDNEPIRKLEFPDKSFVTLQPL